MRFELEGVIGAAGFASGDRVVVGHWTRSPVGPMTDVMWAEPDGRRLLLAPDDRAATFISAVYRFDAVEVVPVDATTSADGTLAVSAGDRRISLTPGRRRWRLPWRRRPPWLTRWVEGPVARAAMGVRTYGVSPTGVREWYRADSWTPLAGATAFRAGEDLGAMARLHPAAGFGFSEAPGRPSLTVVRPLLEDPTGQLDQLVASLGGVGA